MGRAAVFVTLFTASLGCSATQPTPPPSDETTLRVGYGEIGSADALSGVRQLVQILSAEGLARIGEDGRPAASLAKSWNLSANGLSMTIQLRDGVSFHDGSPVTAPIVVTALEQVLPEYMGPAYDDLDSITALDDRQVQVVFRRPSHFLLEALEAPIRKPGSPSVGTGPYEAPDADAPNTLRANATYYQGPPAIKNIVVNAYPNVRSAWADLLRDRIDMLYETGVDALESLTSAKSLSVFTYVRHYQYVLVFNSASGPLQSTAIRKAVSQAIDRDAFVKEGFNGRAIPSSGMIWPQHWALGPPAGPSLYDPQSAAAALSGPGRPQLRFTCLVRPDMERIALSVKRQLEAVGVDMTLQEMPFDAVWKSIGNRDFDAALIELISGPSLFRLYSIWHSGGLANPGGFGNERLDTVFDRVRYATSDDEYRAAVSGLQQIVVDDPPAVFLAWGERARAVNRRFEVAAERDRDPLTTLRLWRPTTDLQYVDKN